MDTLFRRFMTTFTVPAIPAFGAFAAVISTEPTEHLAPARLGAAFLAMAVVWVGGSFLLGRYISRKH